MLITSYSDSLGITFKDLYENLKNIFMMLLGEFTSTIFPVNRWSRICTSDYDEVDPAFGDWEDVKRLGEKYYLMFDFMINHISSI